MRSIQRQRGADEVGLSISSPKRPKHHHPARQSPIVNTKEVYLDNWLAGLSPSSDTMPASQPLPSLDSSIGSSKSSKKSDKSTASVTEVNYRAELGFRNIYIEAEYPPEELMRRARNITSRARISPEMDDRTFEKLMQTRREIQNKGEDELIRQMAPSIIPDFNTLHNSKLARTSNQI